MHIIFVVCFDYFLFILFIYIIVLKYLKSFISSSYDGREPEAKYFLMQSMKCNSGGHSPAFHSGHQNAVSAMSYAICDE
jgi:hypothetical protein